MTQHGTFLVHLASFLLVMKWNISMISVVTVNLAKILCPEGVQKAIVCYHIMYSCSRQCYDLLKRAHLYTHLSQKFYMTFADSMVDIYVMWFTKSPLSGSVYSYSRHVYIKSPLIVGTFTVHGHMVILLLSQWTFTKSLLVTGPIHRGHLCFAVDIY